MKDSIRTVVFRCMVFVCAVVAITTVGMCRSLKRAGLVRRASCRSRRRCAHWRRRAGRLAPRLGLGARDGITGHLDEYHPTFRDAWKGFRVDAPGVAADGTGWPLEQCSYWLDGLVRLGYALHDEALIRKAKVRSALVVDGVNRGANSLIYWKSDKPAGFNSWAHFHMGRAPWWRVRGDRRQTDSRRFGQGLCRIPCRWAIPLRRR